MKIDNKIVQNLARTADIVNTMSGGTIFPTFKTTKEEDHYRLEVTVPSIPLDDIKVEINEGHLFIYQQMAYKDARIPNVLGIQRIATHVDLNTITASFEDDVLVVIMPFNGLSGGNFRKEIDILRY